MSGGARIVITVCLICIAIIVTVVRYRNGGFLLGKGRTAGVLEDSTRANGSGSNSNKEPATDVNPTAAEKPPNKQQATESSSDGTTAPETEEQKPTRKPTSSPSGSGETDGDSQPTPKGEGQRRWLRGSHIRIGGVESPGCRALPQVDSIALLCNPKELFSSTKKETVDVRFTVKLAFPLSVTSTRCIGKSREICASQPKCVASGDSGDGAKEKNLYGCTVKIAATTTDKQSEYAYLQLPNTTVVQMDVQVAATPKLDAAPVCFTSLGDWGRPHKIMQQIAQHMEKVGKPTKEQRAGKKRYWKLYGLKRNVERCVLWC